MVSDELGSEAPTSEAYYRAFASLHNSLTANQLRMLQAHYAAPHHTISPYDLAQVVGYSGRSAVNLQYGKLAKRVGEYLGLKLRYHVQALILFVHTDSLRGEPSKWVMRPQVAQALVQLGWVEKQVALLSGMPGEKSVLQINPPDRSLGFTDWQGDVKRWVLSKRKVSSNLAEPIIAFFDRAFQNTLYPERTWFGVHHSTISLVIGGIYLAAISAGQEIWLLLDQQLPQINGIDYRPVLSTQSSKFPLIWAHSTSLLTITHLIADDRVWESFSLASEKILSAAQIANGRQEVQLSRGKKRLSDFWVNYELNLYPDELDKEVVFREGARRQVTVNAYERNPQARRDCIQHYGARCFICGFDFKEVYGEIAVGFIHVHHLRPLSEIGEEYEIDPVKDLRPVCPNCHAVLHLRKTAFSIEEVRDFIHSTKLN